MTMARCQDCCSIGVNLRLFILMAVVLLYLVFGAFVFSALEEKVENKEVEKLKTLRRDFEKRMMSCNLTEGDLESFLREVVKATETGILVTHNVTFSSSWTFGQSFFFATTLITTIGYGHTLPLSYGGKIFAIFYSLIGLPMVLTMFTAFVARLMVPLTALLNFLKKKYGYINKEATIELVHLSLVVIVVLVFFYLIPAAIFTHIEKDWNYLDSIYYCFISLTTIGLGDYIPGEHVDHNIRPFYKIAVTLYLMLGLICMMTLLAVVYNVSVLNISSYFTKADEPEHEEEQYLTPSNTATPTSYTQGLNDAQ